MGIIWETRDKDRRLISKIVTRAKRLGLLDEMKVGRKHVAMNLVACHRNGCPLDLKKLLEVEEFTFSHDIVKIDMFIDRDTGKLKDHFWPRCAAKVG